MKLSSVALKEMIREEVKKSMHEASLTDDELKAEREKDYWDSAMLHAKGDEKIAKLILRLVNADENYGHPAAIRMLYVWVKEGDISFKTFRKLMSAYSGNAW